MLKKLLELFIRSHGRKPNSLEMILLKQKATKQAVDERKIVSMVDRQPVNPNKPILGGMNVPETESEILKRIKNQNKEAVKNWPEKKAGGGIAGMLGERTGYENGRRAGPAARQRKVTDWYTDKIIRDNMGAIREDMSLYFEEPKTGWEAILEGVTDEDVYGEYDERKGHTGIFKKSFETKDGEIIDLPYRPDKGVDIIGLLELLDKSDEGGVSKDYSVKKRKSIELKGGGLAGMLGE